MFCSRLIEGLVFKKHAAHKNMITKYTNPRLLLIQGMLGPSSVSSGLASFSSLISEVNSRLFENLISSQSFSFCYCACSDKSLQLTG